MATLSFGIKKHEDRVKELQEQLKEGPIEGTQEVNGMTIHVTITHWELVDGEVIFHADAQLLDWKSALFGLQKQEGDLGEK